MKNPVDMPFLSYAFRPFYWAGAVFVMVALLLWRPGQFFGSQSMPAFLWHAHEMIWGFSSAIIVGFLLTAVATWTNQKATQGVPLLLLTLLWLGGRLTAVFENHWISGLLGLAFFLMAIVLFAMPIIKSHNQRNFIAVVILGLLASSQVLFHLALSSQINLSPLTILHMGLLIIAAIIGLIGMRVIPFFISKKLQIPQVAMPKAMMLSTMLLPVLMAILLTTPLANHWLILVIATVLSVLVIYAMVRWHHHGIWQEPLLWVLFIGYGFSNMGIWVMAWGYSVSPFYITVGAHLLAIGGIGVLTLGMMVRTALGHTGRMMVIPAGLRWAFVCMVLSALMRLVANWVPDSYVMDVSSILFVLAFAIYAYQFTPILWQKRADRP